MIFIYDGGVESSILYAHSFPFFTCCLPIRSSRTLAAVQQKLSEHKALTPVLVERIFIEDAIL
jgi:hypothetical protein